MKQSFLLVPVLFALLAVPAAAQPIDLARGQALAQTWCINCHVVSRDQTAPVPAGPPAFPALADNPDVTAEQMANFIRDPHPPMPDMHLTNNEIGDVVGYIQSLKSQ